MNDIKNVNRNLINRPFYQERARTSETEEWSFWKKALLVSISGLAIGIILKSLYHGAPSNAVLDQSTENMLKDVNRVFPNIVVIGDVGSESGKITLNEMGHLGLKYTTLNVYPRDTVPPEVWTQSLHAMGVDEMMRKTIKEKVEKGQVLTPVEKEKANMLQSTAACFLLHRKAIWDTIERYEEAIDRLNELALQADSPEKTKRVEEWEKVSNHYSSVLIFEHNGRFGTVKKDGSVDLSLSFKDKLFKSLDALPEKWEYLTFFVYDHCYPFKKGAKSSWGSPCVERESNTNVPHASSTITADDALTHPVLGTGAKVYAVSNRFFPALKKLFSDVNEKSANRPFVPNDIELYELSEQRFANGGVFHLAPTESLAYRAISPSFHVGSGGYPSRNFGSLNYQR